MAGRARDPESTKQLPTRPTMLTVRSTLAITFLLHGLIAMAESRAPASSTLLSIRSAGSTPGHILIDGEFAGFTPATVRLLESSKKVVIEFGEWGYETRYVLDLSWAKGIASVNKADVVFESDHCLDRDKSDKAKARAWAQKISSMPELPKNLRLPGFARITHGCPFSPWFGEARFYDLSINSTPPGATIVIEGKVVGKTPLKVKLRHDFARNRMNQLRIAASLDGFVTAAQTFVARESQTVTTIDLALQPAR